MIIHYKCNALGLFRRPYTNDWSSEKKETVEFSSTAHGKCVLKYVLKFLVLNIKKIRSLAQNSLNCLKFFGTFELHSLKLHRIRTVLGKAIVEKKIKRNDNDRSTSQNRVNKFFKFDFK